MNKQETIQFLNKNNIWYEITEHEAVYNMEEVSKISIPYPEADAKSIFLRDDKKKNYYLVVVKGNKRLDLKEFRRINNLRSLSFASADDLKNIMNLIPGAVTPLGVLNDVDKRVHVWIDEEFVKSESMLIGVHPNDNTATVWMKVQDLIKIIEEHGNVVSISKMDVLS